MRASEFLEALSHKGGIQAVKHLNLFSKIVKFAIFISVLLLVLAVTSRERFHHEQHIQNKFEQALASFDPETTQFILILDEWLPENIFRKKFSNELTIEQCKIIEDYIHSFRFKETLPYDGYQTGDAPGLLIQFDTPFGYLSLRGTASLETKEETVYFAHFEFDQRLYQQIRTFILDQR